jgi:glycosyltransferase involved in cell wall biosynthesis
VPDVSVVIPTLDRRPYLPNVIQTFLAQDEVKEIIFVIDGCTDGTLEYLKEVSAADSRIRYVDNVVNRGLTYSRNLGLTLASCEYTFTAEDDLTLREGFMATLLAHMRETGADIISARNIFQWPRESMTEAIDRTDKLTGPAINKRLITVDVENNARDDRAQPLLPAPMLARTETFRKIGWDEHYRGSAWREESDFQLTALEAGYKLVYCPHTTSFNLAIENDRSGVHGLTMLGRVRSVTENNWYFVNKHRELIAREFEITRLHPYIARFAMWRIWRDIARPVAMNTASKMPARIREIAHDRRRL